MDIRARPLVARITEGDLKLLRIFRAVTDAGGLSAAESALRMERSTISRHVQALETRLGGALCLRGPAGFELTDLGRTAYRAGITACETLEQIRDELNGGRDAVTGDLRIGLADNCLTNPNAQIVDAVCRFSRAAPGVVLHVSIRPPVELAAELLARRLHLTVNGAPFGDPELASVPLFAEEFRLYVAASAERGLTAEKLVSRGYAVVTRDRDRHSLALANRLGAGRRAVASGLEAVATLIAADACIGFLPTHFASSLSRCHRLVEIAGAESWSYVSDFSLVQNAARPLSRAAQLMKDILLDSHRMPAREIGLA